MYGRTKPFKKLLRVVFVLDADEDPAEVRKPTALFSTDPEMAPERICRLYRDRFQIEFNFRDYRQHLGLAACQARTAARHHFHLNAVLAALAWTRLELRHAAQRALDRFSMANVKLKNFLEMVLQRLLEAVGPDRTTGRGPCPFNISKTVHTIESCNEVETASMEVWYLRPSYRLV